VQFYNYYENRSVNWKAVNFPRGEDKKQRQIPN